MAYAVIRLIGAYIYIAATGGVPGGYEESKLNQLVQVAKKNNAKTVVIEKNFGNGAHANMMKPLFAKAEWPVKLEEVYETGQKELRIIDTLEPLLTSHRLVISPSVLEQDARSVGIYPVDIQITYRLIHQLSMITRSRGCLRKDDRLDALAGAVRYVVDKLDFDTQLFIEAKRRAEQIKEIAVWNDPVSRRVWLTGVQESQRQSAGRNIFDARSKGKVSRNSLRNKFN